MCVALVFFYVSSTTNYMFSCVFSQGLRICVAIIFLFSISSLSSLFVCTHSWLTFTSDTPFKIRCHLNLVLLMRVVGAWIENSWYCAYITLNKIHFVILRNSLKELVFNCLLIDVRKIRISKFYLWTYL